MKTKSESFCNPKSVITFGLLLAMLVTDILMPGSAFAASLPWEGPLETLADSLTGDLAKTVCAAVVCVSGIFVALGEGGPFGRLAGRIVFGLALAIGAMNIVKLF